MADKNKKATDHYDESVLAQTRARLAAAHGLISRVASCLRFGGPVQEQIERLETWCAERERERRAS